MGSCIYPRGSYALKSNPQDGHLRRLETTTVTIHPHAGAPLHLIGEFSRPGEHGIALRHLPVLVTNGVAEVVGGMCQPTMDEHTHSRSVVHGLGTSASHLAASFGAAQALPKDQNPSACSSEWSACYGASAAPVLNEKLAFSRVVHVRP